MLRNRSVRVDASAIPFDRVRYISLKVLVFDFIAAASVTRRCKAVEHATSGDIVIGNDVGT